MGIFDRLKLRKAKDQQHLADMAAKEVHQGIEIKKAQARCVNEHCLDCRHYPCIKKSYDRVDWTIPPCNYMGRPSRYISKTGITLDKIGKIGYDINIQSVINKDKVIVPRAKTLTVLEGKKEADFKEAIKKGVLK